MGTKDIQLADQVRRVLGRHYLNPRTVRIVAGRGNVRIIGELERTGKQASVPVDEDVISRLKNEIKHIKGVKTVAIDFSSSDSLDATIDDEVEENAEPVEEVAKPKSKEERKKAFADALKAAMEAKRKEIFGSTEKKEETKKPKEKSKSKPAAKEEKEAEFKIPLKEEEMPSVTSPAEPLVENASEPEPGPKKPTMKIQVVRYKKYQGAAESSWVWTTDMAFDVLGENNWEQFREAHAFFRSDLPGHVNENPPATVEAYGLPHHILKGGMLRTHWPGVVFAMAALLGQESSINVPRIQKREIYDHLSRHYKDEFNKFPPELIEMAPSGKNYSECEPDELIEEPWGYADFKDYHEKQGISMWWMTLEAWRSAIAADVFIGFDEKPQDEPQQRRSSRILRRISKAFKGSRGRGPVKLSVYIEKLLETVDEIEVMLGQVGAKPRAAEKLTMLSGSLRSFIERYAQTSKYSLHDSHANELEDLDKALGKVFEHVAPRRYSVDDIEALLRVVDRLDLLAKSKSRGE